MLAVASDTHSLPRSRDLCLSEDEGLRNAALKLLQSSAYTSLRGLRCEVKEGVVAVHGSVPTYYLKQMAQTLINRLGSIRSVSNMVEVRFAENANIHAFPSLQSL
jgi:BON domain